MRRFLTIFTAMTVLAAIVLWAFIVAAADISGAGATFPYPLYAKWAEAYKAQSGNNMNYQSIGSGGGIKQIKNKTVDFGASDMPLSKEDLDAAGLVQFPMIMGGVVPVINLKGIDKINLDGALLAQIYLGAITRWDSPWISAQNPGVKLPDKAIAVVHRSDGSGTTYIFSHYLAEVFPEWKVRVGVNVSLEWPVGLGGKGNEGVAALVSRTDGAIGYVEYAYVKQNKLSYAKLKPKDGLVAIEPNARSFQAAAEKADWANAPGFNLLLTNQSGAESWPIVGASFILMHKASSKPEATQETLKFFGWAYNSGGALAESLDYIPMPKEVSDLVKRSWLQIR